MTHHRETTITVFGKTQVIRTEHTGTVKQLETAHTKAVRAALVEAYDAVSDKEQVALKVRLEKRIAKLEPKVRGWTVTDEQRAIRDEIYEAQRTLAVIGKHKFTPAKGEYMDGKPTKVRYVSAIPESVMPYHEYVQDALV
jgi:hypothetical protein